MSVRPGIQQRHPSFYHHCSVYNPLGHSVEYTGLASNRDIHLSIIIVLFTAHWDTVSVRPGIQQKHPSFYHHCSVYMGHSSSTAWHPTETSIFLSSLFCLQPTGTQCRVRPGIQQKHPSFYHHCSVYSPLGHSVEYGLASNRNIHLSIIIVLFTTHWDTVSVRPGIQQKHPSFYHHCSVYSWDTVSTAWHPTVTSIFLSSLFCLQPTGTQCPAWHPTETSIFLSSLFCLQPTGTQCQYGLASNRNIHLSIIIVLFTAHWDTVSSTAWHPTETSIFLSSLCVYSTAWHHHCSVYSPLGHSVEYGLASNRNIHLSIIIVLFTAHWDTVSSTAWHPTETSIFLSSLFCLQPTGTTGHTETTETSIFLSSLFCLQPTGTQCRVRPGIQQKHPSFYHHCSVYNPLGHSIEYGLASNRNIHLSIIIVLFTAHWDTVSVRPGIQQKHPSFYHHCSVYSPLGHRVSTAWHPTETSIFLSSLFCLQPTGTQCRVRPGIQQKHPSFYHHHCSVYSVEYGLASNRNIHLSIIIVLFTAHWDTVSSTAWHPTETSIFLSSLFCLQPTGTPLGHSSVYSPLGHRTAWHPTETSIFLSSLFCLQPTGTQCQYGLASNRNIHLSIIIVLFTAHWDTVSSTAWHPTETSIFLSSLFCLQPTGTQYRVRPGIQQKHPSFYHHCSVYSPLGHSVEYGLASNRNIHLSIIIVLFTAHWDTVSSTAWHPTETSIFLSSLFCLQPTGTQCRVRPGIQQKHPSFYHHCSVYSPLGHSVEYGLASNRNIHLSIIIVLFTAHWDTVSSTAWHPTETSIFLSSLFCLQPTGTQCRVRPGIQQKHPSFYHHCSVYSPLGHSVEYGLASNRNIHLSIIIVLFTTHWDTVSSTAWHPTETSIFLSSLFCLQPTGTQYDDRKMSMAWHPTETSIFLSSLFCLQPTGTQCRVRPGIQQKHPSFYHHCSVYNPLGHRVSTAWHPTETSIFLSSLFCLQPTGTQCQYGLASNRNIHLSIIIVLFTAHWDTVSSTAWHPTETSIFLSSLFCLQPTGTQCRVRPGIQQKHPSFYHHCSVYSPLGHSVEYGLASNRNIHLSIIIVLFTAHWDTVSSTAWHPTETSIFLSSLFCLQPTGTQCRVRPGIQQKHPSFYHHCSVYSPLGHSVEYGLASNRTSIFLSSLFCLQPTGTQCQYGLASNRNIHLSIIIVLFTAHWDTVSSTAWHPTETSIFLSSLFCLQPTGTPCHTNRDIHLSIIIVVFTTHWDTVSSTWHPTETSIFLSSLFCLQPTGTQCRVRPGIQQKHPSFYHHCSVYSPLGHSVEYGLASNRTSIFLSSLFCLQPTGTQYRVRPGIQQKHPVVNRTDHTQNHTSKTKHANTQPRIE